jgi:hypothetical protein
MIFKLRYLISMKMDECPLCEKMVTIIIMCKDGGAKICPNYDEPFHISKKNDIHKVFIHECDCACMNKLY